MPTLPPTLSPKYWDKYKDLPAPQKKKLTDALSAAKGKADKADLDALESAKPKNPAEADAFQKQFENTIKSGVDPLIGEIDGLQKILKSLQSDIGKSDKKPKGIVEDLSKAIADAAAFVKTIESTVAASRKTLQEAIDAAEAAAKKEKDKDAKDAKGKGAASKEMTPPQRKLRAQAIQTLNLARKNDPRTAGKLLALIGYLPGKVLRASMGLKVSKSHIQLAVEPDLKNKLKWVHANIVWDADRKLVIFELKAPLQGGLKALKAGLAEQIRVKNVRVGVRKHNGEEEAPPANAAEDTDELESLQGEVAEDAAAAATEAGNAKTAKFDLIKRLAEKQKEIAAALASPKRAEAQKLMKKLSDARDAGDFDTADAVLDEIDTLLDSDDAPADGATAEQSAAAAAGKSPKQAAAAGATAQQAAAAGAKPQAGGELGELLKSLNRAVQGVSKGIDTFQQEMVRIYEAEEGQADAVNKAKTMLNAAKGVCTGSTVLNALADAVRQNDAAQRAKARQAVAAFEQAIRQDAVISQLDSNELIPMDVVGQLTAELQRARSVLN